MKKMIMISAIAFVLGSKALAQTWWLKRADSNMEIEATSWSSPLISLKECEAARRKLSSLINDSTNGSIPSKLICQKGNQ